MFDEDMGPNKLIGGTSLSLLPYCDPRLSGKEDTFTLYHKVETDPNDRYVYIYLHVCVNEFVSIQGDRCIHACVYICVDMTLILPNYP